MMQKEEEEAPLDLLQEEEEGQEINLLQEVDLRIRTQEEMVDHLLHLILVLLELLKLETTTLSKQINLNGKTSNLLPLPI